jgi:hypothetical protein
MPSKFVETNYGYFCDPWTYGTCFYNLWEVSLLEQRTGFIPTANLKICDLKTRSEYDRQRSAGRGEGQGPEKSLRSGVGSLEKPVFSEDLFLEAKRKQVFILQ